MPTATLKRGVPMTDDKLMEMFLRRESTAVACAQKEYGKCCMQTARRILRDEEDARQCFNEAFLRAWQTIPPENPTSLRAYLLRLVREIAIEKYMTKASDTADTPIRRIFDELESTLLVPETELDSDLVIEELSEVLNSFLSMEPVKDRICFLRRYWYGESVKEIAAACDLTEEKARAALSRSKKRLRAALVREETYI